MRGSHSSTCLDASVHRLSRHSGENALKSSQHYFSISQQSNSRLAHANDYASAQDENIEPNLSKRIMSIPLLQVVIDVIRSQPLSSPVASVETEIMDRLAEEIVNPASPWFKLKPAPSPIIGDRRMEHYSCAVEIALAARSGLRNERKLAKFWKKLALQTDPSAITPSPSDVSDTGISPNLSGQRQELLEELVKRR